MGKINRKKTITHHNPVLNEIEYESPLCTGNGDFCFTCDATGFQTLYTEYSNHDFPLCTMSSWGWHTEPYSGMSSPSRDEIQLTEYNSVRGKQKYAVKKFPGNEKVYDWFRENPHRLNLARIALKDAGQKISAEQLSCIRQELHLYDGYISSSFAYKNTSYSVITVCDPETGTVSFSVELHRFGTQTESREGDISVEIEFPYGSPKKEASVWDAPLKHTTITQLHDESNAQVKRILDRDSYWLLLNAGSASFKSYDTAHKISCVPFPASKEFTVSCTFAPDAVSLPDSALSFNEVFVRSKKFWNSYWENGGFIDFSKSTDRRSFELERRIILSQYVLVTQSCGTLPPQETGLSCSSWYGKFHLEMYPFHTAWLALWGHESLLEKSLTWFPRHLERAKENARKNGFTGARWPKMTGPDAVDSPSPIATLLIWQQPHLLFLLELVYQSGKGREFLEQYRECVYETAQFMADFVFFDANTETWNIESPVIPVQEEFDPDTVKNPAFEVEYWRFGLLLAAGWFRRLGENYPSQWTCIAQNMAPMPFHDGYYTAHENCPETFSVYTNDHPSMLMSCGFIPNDRIDAAMMKRTLLKVMSTWNYESLWGWDFAVMALTASRLGDHELAADLLMTQTSKNIYTAAGHNRQSDRQDLPLYLPGNGSLLLAAAHLAVKGVFSKGNWDAEYENLRSLFN